MLEKILLPEKVLLLARSVEDAAVMVMVEPALKTVPLMVPRDEVATSLLLASSARREFALMPVNQDAPELVNIVVLACVAKVDEAMSENGVVDLSQMGVEVETTDVPA